MDELELLEMFCKDAKINKDEPIYTTPISSRLSMRKLRSISLW